MTTTTRRHSPQRWFALAVIALMVFAIGWAGSAATLPKIPTWYASLTKPSFNPPPWVFGPVWSTLYALMAVAAWRVWVRAPAGPPRGRALALFAAQLLLNGLWPFAFFGLENPRLALAIIVALLAVLLATIIAFFRLDRLAGWLLIPYVLWIAFATVLNAAIVALN